MNKSFFLIICICLIFNTRCFANTIEIQIDYNLSSKLEYDPKAMSEIKTIGNDFKKVIETGTFNNDFFYKLDFFIKQNKNSVSSLTALQMIAGMCFFPETNDLYSKKGEQILDFIIAKYSNSIHGKVAIIAKAVTLTNKGAKKEAIELLEENSKTILSIESDTNYQKFLEETNLKNTDDEFIIAGYYNLLGCIYSDLKNNKKAILNFNKVIKLYPKTNYAKISKEILENLK